MRSGCVAVLCVAGLVMIGCGKPAKKRSGKDDPVQINNGATNNGAQNNGGENNGTTCGAVSCDDRNACTIDSGEQDPSTCVTECSYERESECVDGDGCCPVGCGQTNDDDCDGTNQDRCGTTCAPAQSACVSVVTTADADGCVIGCEYRPVDVCLSGDGCCPSGCGSSDSDCEGVPDNNGVNNGTCTPRTCSQLAVECGNFDDGCGGVVRCGECGDGICIGGTCQDDATGCDPSVSGSCPASTPYCLNGTCSECIGSADCASGELCEDGFCRDSPSCSNNPSLCPDGYACVNDECRVPQGQSCDPNDPASCPQGTFCDPSAAQCVAAGGGAGCGLCAADCTCPGGECDGFLCTCDFANPVCPDGAICIPGDFAGTATGICFPGL